MGESSSQTIVFLVTLPGLPVDRVVIAHARDREEAKRLARPVLRYDADRYVVEPLTKAGVEVFEVSA